MNGIELAALDTLQYGLAGDAEKAHCLIHREVTLRRFIDKAGSQILAQANAPRSSRGQLLTADEAVIEPAVDGRGGGSKDRGRLFDSQQLAFRADRGRLEARDLPLPPQVADMVGSKAMTVGGLPLLTVEDTGDDGVWVMCGQTANERDCALVGAYGRRRPAWQIEIDIDEAATSPPQGEAGPLLGLEHGDDDLFEQGSQQLLAIARCGGRRLPYALQIGAEREQAVPVFCAECARSFTFAPGELGFGLLELAQARRRSAPRRRSDKRCRDRRRCFCRRSGSPETRCDRCSGCAAVARMRRSWPAPAAVRFLLSRHRLSDAAADACWPQCATDWFHRSPSR